MDYGFSSLKDLNVLITGGSGAIGKAIADAFVSFESNVYLWGHRDIDNHERYAYYKIVELESIDSIETEFCSMQTEFDVLVNCAGFTSSGESSSYDFDLWKKTMSINVDAPFRLCQLVYSGMKKRGGGAIINITSIGAEVGFPDNPAYGASKSGLKQLSKALACDWAKDNIRVNNVGPGYTKTKMTKGSWNDETLRKQRTDRMMIKRWAEPEDIAGLVLFLASDMGKYITAQDVYVDGGWTGKGM